MTKLPDAKPAKHVLTCRVYYEDTDAGGLVYHANHLRFAERGRTEMLRSVGYDHHRVGAEFGILLVVKNIEIDYKAPVRLDDLLDITTEALTVGNTSLVMKQVISCQNRVLAELKVVVVAITPEGKPMRWPPQLRQIFLPSSPLAEA